MVETIWELTRRHLRTALSAKDYHAWIAPLHATARCEDELTIAAPNAFFLDWVRRHYLALLDHCVALAAGRPVRLVLVVDRALEQTEDPEPRDDDTRSAPSGSSRADDAVLPRSARHTFASFVVGTTNAMAFEAARKVVEHPGERFSPLFIHGGVGLGKTHLIGAIGNEVRARGRKHNVCILTAEEFVNQMIGAIRRNQMERFRQRYRRVGTLIVDDIQFLAGKVRSQEEFGHTFNALHEACRQIVLVSDRRPQEMPGIEDALRTRFASGLCVGIDAPDAALRVALVERKAADLGLALEHDVVHFLASRSADNVRMLEGALTKLVLMAGLSQRPITLGTARAASDGPAGSVTTTPSLDEILDVVCESYHLSRGDLASRRRTARVVLPRQVAMLLCRRYTEAPLGAIGEELGGRDHSTIVYGLSAIERRLREDAELRTVVSHIERRIAR